MGDTTVLPPSRVPRRTKSVAELYSSTRRLSINPACMANPAAPKKPKRPGSVRGGEPQAKRARGSGEPDRAAAVEIGSAKDRPCPGSSKDLQRRSKRVDSVQSPVQLCESTATLLPSSNSTRTSSLRDLATAVDTGSKDRPCPGSGKDLQKSSKPLDSAVIKSQSVQSPVHLCQSKAAQPGCPSSSSSSSIRELIERARLAKARPAAEEAMEIQRRRMDARRKLEQMVATVEFNDPFIEPEDVCRSRQQLLQAREVAAAAEARIIAMARGPVIEAEEAPGCSYFLC